MSVKLWLYRTGVIGTLDLLSRSLAHLPGNDLARDGIASEHDVAYIDDGDGAHTLDIHMPTFAPKPWPIAVYIHGGGFKFFDKATHWPMAAKFARAGYLTFNINYRLAPKHPYPAAVEDAFAANEWIAANAARFGGDLDRVVLAGESAGANLALGCTIAACYERSEPHARRLFERGLHPKVLLPACGYLQVSDPKRHAEKYAFAPWMQSRILQVSDSYLPDHASPVDAHAFADPLPLLRSLNQPKRRFPATFAIVGGNDPVRGDTLALGKWLTSEGVVGACREYPGGVHAFHAAVFTALGRQAWDDQMTFLNEHMPPRGAADA